MSLLLAFDTATRATVVGLRLGDGDVLSRRDDPAEGSRPGHARRLLALCQELLDEAGVSWQDVERLGVGVGPGGFTGLRIGVATARALSQATDAAVVPISTLEALACGAREGLPAMTEMSPGGSPSIAAVIDARRGEAFIATWDSAGEPLTAPVAASPEALGALADPAGAPWLAAGDGAVRFRDRLESAFVTVPGDESPLHLVGAAALCGLTATGVAVERDALVPDYVRRPDAEISRPQT